VIQALINFLKLKFDMNAEKNKSEQKVNNLKENFRQTGDNVLFPLLVFAAFIEIKLLEMSKEGFY